MARTAASPYQTALALAKKVDQSPLDLAEAIWRLKRKEPGRLRQATDPHASGVLRKEHVDRWSLTFSILERVHRPLHDSA
jgi:hypothetical protein